jgi:hypothetical protein
MGELYLRSFLDITNADFENTFVFPGNARVHVTAFGIVAMTLSGTGVTAELRYRSAGQNHPQSLRTALSGIVMKRSGTLTGPGWLAYRVSPDEGPWFSPELARGFLADGDTSDGNSHGHIKIRLVKDTISSFSGYGWVQARIWSQQDEGGSAGSGTRPTNPTVPA